MTATTKRRQRLLAVLIVLGAGAAVVAVAWFQSEDPIEIQPLIPKAAAIAPGVYYLGRSTPAAAYVVDTSDGLVLVDSGLDESAATIKRQLSEVKLDVRRLRAILLTHVHADHSLGAARLRAETGAKVYAGRGDCAPLRDGGPREAFFSTYHMPHVTEHATPVDIELTGGETITMGDARFEVMAAPGHTPGSVCYRLERRRLRVLFTGDVVQSLSPANPHVLGIYAASLAPIYRGEARAYLTTLQQLRALPVPDLILPGHPRMDPTPQDPRLPPERWHAILDQGIASLEQLLARRAADGANFLDGSPKELLAGLHYLGDCQRRAVYVLDTARGWFLVDAPGGAGLVPFLAERSKGRSWEGRPPTAVLLTSADDATIAGLAPLVQNRGCKVVAPKAGRDVVARACPAGTEILFEDDLEKKGWFEVKAIPLEGRGMAPVAFQLHWAGKTVLISGRIPVMMTAVPGEHLLRDLHGPGGDPAAFARSLERLRRITPDLWLPAEPVNAQNANLYDRDWDDLLGNWLRVIR